MNKNVFAPFMSTVLELADSKKAMIFLLGLIAIANADACGFPGIYPTYRLAGAIFLGCVWIVSQSVVDTWGKSSTLEVPNPPAKPMVPQEPQPPQ